MASLEEILEGKIKEQLRENMETGLFRVDMLYPKSEIEDALRNQTKKLNPIGDEEGLLDGLDDIFDLDLPISKENDTKVKVTYEKTGGIGYVDLSFSKLDQELTQEQYDYILDNLKIMSTSRNASMVIDASKKIEVFGDRAIEAIFRQIRLFNFKSKDEKYKIDSLVNLGTKITILSLKGRMLLKAILQHAKNQQHIELAIRIAGQINEKEVLPEILEHAKQMDLFNAAFEAILRMKSTAGGRKILNLIKSIEIQRKDVIEQTIQLAKNFNELDTSIIKELFNYYLQCKNRHIRPIYSTALKSFKDEVIPVLYEFIEYEYDTHLVREACKILGGIRKPIASQKLKEAYENLPAKRASIIEGMGHTSDPSLVTLIVEELRKASKRSIKQTCIKTLGSLGTKDHIPFVRTYMEDKDIKSEAIYCLVKLGDKEAMNVYLNLLVKGDQEEQQTLSSFASLLSFKDLITIARKMVSLPDPEAIMLLSALQRPNVLPKEIGQFLKLKLEQKPSAPVRIEIYRLIGKFVNTSNELLPQQILYSAKQKENEGHIKREIDFILKNIQTNRGGIIFGYKGEE